MTIICYTIYEKKADSILIFNRKKCNFKFVIPGNVHLNPATTYGRECDQILIL